MIEISLFALFFGKKLGVMILERGVRVRVL